MDKLENKKWQYYLSRKYVVLQFNLKKGKLFQLRYVLVSESIN